jgi:hypothetical protein
MRTRTRKQDGKALTEALSLVTRAAFLSPHLVICRTVHVWVMFVSHVLEKVDLRFVCEERYTKGMNWGISPSFIVESALAIQVFKVIHVRFAPPEVHIGNLEIRPNWDERST